MNVANCTHLTVQEIIERLISTIGRDRLPTPLHTPEIGPSAWTYVKDCLDTNWVSSVGAYVNRFEQMVSEFVSVDHAVATVNGTAALHIALLLAGVDRDSEVMMPSLTFVATANAASYIGALPHFVEVDSTTLGIDAERLAEHLQKICQRRGDHWVNRETGRRIGAVVGMHTFGHPLDVDGLVGVCQEFELPFIEDAAEALGSYYHGQHVGGFGRLGILSFNGNKTITTGGGGMVLTRDSNLASQAKHLTTTGKLPHAWEFVHDCIAYNYRLPNLNAALGCSQMEDLPRLLSSKRKLAEDYLQAFQGTNVRIVREPDGCRSNYWLNAILFDVTEQSERDCLLRTLNEAGLGCRPIWVPMHRLPMYQDHPRMADLQVTELLSMQLINIPSSSHLRSCMGLQGE